MNNYQYLDNLIFSYFNQDSDLDGNAMNELVSAYKSTNSEEQISQLSNDRYNFILDADDNIEKMFIDKYGFDVDPALWDHTAKFCLEKCYDG